MTINEILNTAGIPLMLFAASIYFAIRTHISKDPSAFRGRNSKPLKNNDAYCSMVEKIMIFFGVASLIYGILLFVNMTFALIVLVISILIAAFLFKRLNDLYGETK